MKTLWLVRHGATAYSAERRYLGWKAVPLSEQGLEQARQLHTRLHSQPFRSIWTSDLLRSCQTALLAGFPRAQVSSQLREFDFGRMEGLTWKELAEEDQSKILTWSPEFRPGSESLAEFSQRVLGFCRHLPSGQHLLFCHGGVCLCLQRALNLPAENPGPGQWIRLEFPEGDSPGA